MSLNYFFYTFSSLLLWGNNQRWGVVMGRIICSATSRNWMIEMKRQSVYYSYTTAKRQFLLVILLSYDLLYINVVDRL